MPPQGFYIFNPPELLPRRSIAKADAKKNAETRFQVWRGWAAALDTSIICSSIRLIIPIRKLTSHSSSKSFPLKMLQWHHCPLSNQAPPASPQHFPPTPPSPTIFLQALKEEEEALKTVPQLPLPRRGRDGSPIFQQHIEGSTKKRALDLGVWSFLIFLYLSNQFLVMVAFATPTPSAISYHPREKGNICL